MLDPNAVLANAAAEWDAASEAAARVIEKMHAEEMERIGLMVAFGIDTQIAEAVAARLKEASAAIRKRKRCPPQAGAADG